MHPSDSDALETIDAMVFTGDSLHNAESLATFKEYVDRWNREMESIRAGLEHPDGDTYGEETVKAAADDFQKKYGLPGPTKTPKTPPCKPPRKGGWTYHVVDDIPGGMKTAAMIATEKGWDVVYFKERQRNGTELTMVIWREPR